MVKIFQFFAINSPYKGTSPRPWAVNTRHPPVMVHDPGIWLIESSLKKSFEKNSPAVISKKNECLLLRLKRTIY